MLLQGKRGNIVSINTGSVPFTSSLVSRAPDAAGVFALWQSGGVVYYGKASSGAATIRKALDEQLQGRAFSERRVTGCSWEVSSDPELRLRELLHDYEIAHRCMPLWNDPQRLPTD
jgi:hypothetical protein